MKLKHKNYSKKPWFSNTNVQAVTQKNAIVIGAGLAGATIAYALSQEGFKVKVLEQATTVGTQASGNLAGAINPLITADWNLRSQLYFKGFEHTLRWLKPWLDSGEVIGNLNGLVQLMITPTITERMHKAIQTIELLKQSKNFCYLVDSSQASKILGLNTPFAGIFFPQGGWIYPDSVIKTCLKHKKITLHLNIDIVAIEQKNKKWCLSSKEEKFYADILCVATGALSKDLNSILDIPIRPVKGQITQIGKEYLKEHLKIPAVHRGYSVSLPNGDLLTGATFEVPDMNTECSYESDLENIKMLNEALDGILKISDFNKVEILQSRSSFRPTTIDHIPVWGAVPDRDFMNKEYMSQNSSRMPSQYKEQQYQTGLYVSNGHGARGLLSVFLAADEIIRQIKGIDSKLDKSLRHAVHPARFSIRKWRQNKI